MTKNKKEYSVNEARYSASVFLGVDENTLHYLNRTDGNFPLYYFSDEKGTTIISVCINGGYIESFHNTSPRRDTKLDYDRALIKAESFLKEKHFDNMKSSYGYISNGIGEFNFSYVHDGVICYSDLIKVGVALDTGEIVNFSATGYLMNHYTREIPAKTITLGQAASNLSKNLTVKSENIALIPTDGKNEVLCYEFYCTGEENDQLLIYINSATGMEENIFILLEDENGTLTI